MQIRSAFRRKSWAWKVKKEIEKIGISTILVKTDVSNVDEIKEMVNKVVQKYGTVDILVNNAGIVHNTSIEDIDEEEWDRIMAVNLKSVFFPPSRYCRT